MKNCPKMGFRWDGNKKNNDSLKVKKLKNKKQNKKKKTK